MEDKGYIATLKHFSSRDKKLRSSAIDILQCFDRKDSMSVNDVYSILKPTEKSIAYKNVHKTFREFRDWDYIRYLRTGQHNSKLYRLTPQGIFVLFKTLSRDSITTLPDPKGVFQYYANELIFYEFIYPCISNRTLLNLKNTDIHRSLFHYLHLCCLEIESFLKLFVDRPSESRKWLEIIEYRLRTLIYSEFISPLLYWHINKLFDQSDLIKLAHDINFMRICGQSQDLISDNYMVLKKLKRVNLSFSTFQ